jgi:hypothetical protein
MFDRKFWELFDLSVILLLKSFTYNGLDYLTIIYFHTAVRRLLLKTLVLVESESVLLKKVKVRFAGSVHVILHVSSEPA